MLRQANNTTTQKPISSPQSDGETKKKKSRGLSPFNLRTRGTSPFRRNNSNGKSRGISPFRKGSSPATTAKKAFAKKLSHSSSSSLGSSSGKKEAKEDIVVCHGSARSIVFRDHLRLAAKIIHEETNEDILSDDEFSSDDDSDDDSAIDAGFQHMSHALERSLRESIRESIRESLREHRDNSDKMANEINSLAHNMVPELKDVTLRVQDVSERNVEIEGQQVHLTPLPKLELGPTQTFEALENDRTTDMDEDIKTKWTLAEQDVYQLLKKQQACVKTIKNSEWPSFLQRFQTAKTKDKLSRFPTQHDDIPPKEGFPFNSFVTSTTLLPELGRKMRAYGSLHAYPVGVVFGLPSFDSPKEEDKAATQSKTWSWPAGYAAKTEFNIERGKLINGREEALEPLSQMRKYNYEYVHNKDHLIGGKLIKGGFQVVPYNEVFLRIGGRGRIVCGKDVVTQEERDDAKGTGRSYETGMGLPVALFIRSTTIGDILTLFRTKARLEHVLGDQYIHGIPLLVITPDYGVRVFSEDLQHQFWKLAAHKVNPFQNPILEPMLRVDDTHQEYLHQKALEQISFFDDDDDENTEKLSSYLTIEECARLAGGFGATDESWAKILMKAREQDLLQGNNEGKSKKVSPDTSRHGGDNLDRQDNLNKVMSIGLDAALRSNDYYTARQLLIVYSLVSTGHHEHFDHTLKRKTSAEGAQKKAASPNHASSPRDGHEGDMEESLEFSYRVSESSASALSPTSDHEEEKSNYAQSLPRPLDTWRLRNATNSQGILFVLGAVEILSAVRNGNAQSRTAESIAAIEEWVQYGEESVSFRIASWSKLRATEHDTNVALEGSSQFMAFVSNKAITNRKGFAQKLKAALEVEGGSDSERESEKSHLQYLKRIQEIVNSLHAPCLRLEILQYILGLDNRFSVDHIRHSMELAVTCTALGLS